MLGSIADGVSEVHGFLEGLDSLATLGAFRTMGVRIDGPVDGHVRIHGAGLHGLHAPPQQLDLGNSGTSMRLLAGLLAGQEFDCILTGDESLSQRPMRRVTAPLAEMGAMIETTQLGTPPLTIHGVGRLNGVVYRLPVASAQVKSAVLLAGLYARGTTCVIEPVATRDHTERMLAAFGYPIHRQENRVCLDGGGRLRAIEISIPADISSAAFFMVGAAMCPGSDIVLEQVGINPTRTGVINILRLMDADIQLENRREFGGEPVADIRVRGASLKGVHIPPDQVSLAIDEFPVLMIAAAAARGTTVVTGAGELRVKESDRISGVVGGLQQLGIRATAQDDGMTVEGGELKQGEVDSLGDHRIAMAFAMAALKASGPVIVRRCENIETSFPGFVSLARAAGLNIQTAS